MPLGSIFSTGSKAARDAAAAHLGMRKCKDDLLVLQARPFEHQLAGQVLKIVGAGAKAMHEQHQQVR
eukprot:scaffold7654_cov258-Pinguiococcus_pyrenoidosus.AAC.1